MKQQECVAGESATGLNYGSKLDLKKPQTAELKARNVRRTPQCHEEGEKNKKKRKINHELKSHHKFLFSQHAPKANIVRLKTTFDAKNNIYKSGDRIFPRRIGGGKKLWRPFGGDKKILGKQNQNTVGVNTNGCATWKQKTVGTDKRAAPRSRLKIHLRSRN